MNIYEARKQNARDRWKKFLDPRFLDPGSHITDAMAYAMTNLWNKQITETWEAKPMNTDKPSMKKERRATISVTDLIAQMAGQQAHEQVQKLDDEFTQVIIGIKRQIAELGGTSMRTELLGKMHLIDQQCVARCDGLLKVFRMENDMAKSQFAAQVFTDPCSDVAKKEAQAVCSTLEKSLMQEIKKTRDELRAYRIEAIKRADLGRVENSLQRKGFTWPEAEDKQLLDEMATAMETIAANHGRSVHSIRCRIRDKKILTED
jgi:hypothetical protein